MRLLKISYFFRLVKGLLLVGAVTPGVWAEHGVMSAERKSQIGAVAGDSHDFLSLQFSPGSFASVKNEDALLASRLVERHLQEGSGRTVQVTHGELRGEEVASGKASVIMLTADEYISSRPALKKFQPVTMSVARGAERRGGSVWVLMARQEDNSLSFSELDVAEGEQGPLARWWLRTGLPSRQAGSPFNISLMTEPDPSVALLRVYLGVRPACLVPEWALIQASVANPDVGRRLVRVAETPPLPGVVLGVRLGTHARENEHLCELLRRLNDSTQGRAVAALLRWEGFSAFNTTLFAPLEKFLPVSSRVEAVTRMVP